MLNIVATSTSRFLHLDQTTLTTHLTYRQYFHRLCPTRTYVYTSSSSPCQIYHKTRSTPPCLATNGHTWQINTNGQEMIYEHRLLYQISGSSDILSNAAVKMSDQPEKTGSFSHTLSNKITRKRPPEIYHLETELEKTRGQITGFYLRFCGGIPLRRSKEASGFAIGDLLACQRPPLRRSKDTFRRPKWE